MIRITIKHIIISAVIVVLATWAIIQPLVSPFARRLFIFPNAQNEKLQFEERFLDITYLSELGNPQNESVIQFVEELILGPIDVTSKRLYPKQTQIENSFIADNTLYVNLSENALMNSAPLADMKKNYDVFIKNIFTNFKNIDIIRMYINNKEVYTSTAFK